jgi:hypothetical protein
MCAEASTVLRAVAADFFFNCWYLEILSDNCIRHIPKFKNMACNKPVNVSVQTKEHVRQKFALAGSLFAWFLLDGVL